MKNDPIDRAQVAEQLAAAEAELAQHKATHREFQDAWKIQAQAFQKAMQKTRETEEANQKRNLELEATIKTLKGVLA